MSIRYKPDVDIIAMLKAAGYTTYRLRQEHLISESALTKMRAHTLPSWKELDVLCRLLNCQPGDIIERTPTETPAAEPTTGAQLDNT